MTVTGRVQECKQPAPNPASYRLHPTSASGVHDVFDDDQAAIQELEAEEGKPRNPSRPVQNMTLPNRRQAQI